MTLDTFFEKFDLFADAPNAVAKMRELVLELAVKGALSERHASEQDDPAWREFIAKFDQRRSDSDIGTETPFEIPDEWRWARLDDLGTTRVRNDVEDSTRVSFVPMALISSTYGVAAQSEERTWSEIKKGFTHFADGDVVMAKITPCFENAKSAVMRNLVNGVGAGTTELHVFRRGTDLVLPEFVLLYVKTRGFITRGEPRMTGSAGQKRVPREYFATSPFPLPPLAEQKRIVAKVDELMALCDRLVAQHQERETRHAALARASLARFADAPTPTNLPFLFHPSYAIPPADLRKSILTLAVQGKLVPQDPNDEPAEDTLANVLRARERQEKSLRIKEPSPVEADAEHTPDLTPGWCYASPDQLTAFHKNALTIGPFGSSLLKSDYTDEGVPLVFVRDIRSESFGGPETRFVTPDKADELASHTVRPGDLLITKMGDPPGDTAIYPEGRPPAIITADCIKLTPHSGVVSAEYLRFTIRAS
jgi:type I restriction enzyme S subunit